MYKSIHALWYIKLSSHIPNSDFQYGVSHIPLVGVAVPSFNSFAASVMDIDLHLVSMTAQFSVMTGVVAGGCSSHCKEVRHILVSRLEGCTLYGKERMAMPQCADTQLAHASATTRPRSMACPVSIHSMECGAHDQE